MELHQKKINLNLSTKQFDIEENRDSNEQDFVTIEGYASKMFTDGKTNVDLDGEAIQTSAFSLEAKRLLLNHELDEPVGEIELSHRPDGIYLKGIVYKDTMKDQDWARLKRKLFDFSVGFIAEQAEYKEINGKEVLVFTKGIVYEVSLVAIPSNKYATLDVIKSVKSDSGNFTMECSIEHIKSMNPNMDCSCLASLKEDSQQKQIQREDMNIEVIKEKIRKGLTIEETMNESWNITDDLFQMLGYFRSTIEDNVYEFKWNDQLSREEMLANITQAMDIFKATLETETSRIGTAIGKNFEASNSLKVTKEVSTEAPTEVAEPIIETVVAPIEETPAVEIIEETKSEATEEVVEQIIPTESKEEVISDENIDQKSETNELANTLDFKQETINILKADLEQLSGEDIKALYNSLADKLDSIGAYDAITALQKIEQYVEQELIKNN